LARADGSAAASETALSLFNEGLALRARGELDAAIAKLRAAHALRATPVTAFELARAYTEHLDLVEARDLLLSIKRIPVASGESRDAQAARHDAATLADDLKQRIPSLTITLTGPGATSKPTVFIDDVEVPPEAVAEPQRLNPRRHHVVARAEGAKEASADVQLQEAENARVVMELSGGRAVPLSAAPPRADERVDARAATLAKVLVFGGFSLAIATAAVGTFAGLHSIDQVGSLKSSCNGEKICAPDQADAISGARTWGNVATTSFIAMGVGLVIGAVGLLLWPRAEGPIR
jgi:hypothetical protein